MGAEKYFIFDNELWNIGHFAGCKPSGNGVLASPENAEDSPQASKAYYFSGPIDSGANETAWHKFLLDYDGGEGNVVYMSYFASDEHCFVYGGETIFINELIESEELTVSEKLAALSAVWAERVINPDNVLLSKAKGRYFWFLLEIVMFSRKETMINGLKIEFPHHSISNMLPAVYRKNQEPYSFFNRFLCVYQSFYEEMLENINNISRFFDSDAVNSEFLSWLADWLGIKNDGIWNEEQLRRLIKRIYGTYRKKGTKEGLSEIIAFYTGEPPLIIENYEILYYYDDKEYGKPYKMLYGDSEFAFYVFICENSVKSAEALDNIKRLTEAFSPANAEPFVVPLNSYTGIGKHTYLGINSQIVKNSGLMLDEFLTLDNNTKL